MEFKLGRYYYFWDKKLNKLAELRVIERYSNGFKFSYNDQEWRVKDTTANGHVFASRYDVPQYRQELERIHQEHDEMIAKAQKAYEARFPKKSCDFCMERHGGRCGELRRTVCEHFRPGPIRPHSITG